MPIWLNLKNNGLFFVIWWGLECYQLEHDVTILPPTVRLCLALLKKHQEKTNRNLTDDWDK